MRKRLPICLAIAVTLLAAPVGANDRRGDHGDRENRADRADRSVGDRDRSEDRSRDRSDDRARDRSTERDSRSDRNSATTDAGERRSSEGGSKDDSGSELRVSDSADGGSSGSGSTDDATERAAKEAADVQKDVADRQEQAEKDAADAQEQAQKDFADAQEQAQKDYEDAQKEALKEAEDAAKDADDSDEREAATSLADASEALVERDDQGRERRAAEVMVVTHDRGGDDQFQPVEGYRVISSVRLEGLGLRVARLRPPNGLSVDQALSELTPRMPDATVSSNFVYRIASGAPDFRARGASRQTRPTPERAATNQATTRLASASQPSPATRFSAVRSGRIGVIDTGVDRSAPLLRDFVSDVRAFAAPVSTPAAHGSTVAAIAAKGGAEVIVADVFGPSIGGGAAATDDSIAAAVDWLVASGVRVINISAQGPESPALAAVIKRAQARGALIVAAAGNSGPNAPPVYPAAYPGVVAVTAVDQAQKVYWRANRGPHITFAAMGVGVPACCATDAPEVSGTSFAAPKVAAALAQRMGSGDGGDAISALRREAVDLGPRGKDSTYGWGYLDLK